MDINKYRADLPYPKITTDVNFNDAKHLMPDYAGPKGELTAILTYCYQSYVSKEYSEMLMGIAQVEMHHHEMLGKTIVALGGYPVMGGRTYWSGSFVDYTVAPKKFLINNISSEENAIVNYERTILCLQNNDVKKLIERIILDEKIHIQIFKDYLSRL